MDYERIEKPHHQGGNTGGFSPGKLRSMLLGGAERKRKEEEEKEVDESLSFASTLTWSSRSQHQHQQQQQLANVDSDGCDSCKDVDVVVSVLPDAPECCSTSSTADSSLPAQMMISDRRLKDQSRIRSQQDYSLDYEAAHAHTHDGIFDFERQQRHQLPIAPFSKPAPSKWDDAQKWIASPNSIRPRNQAGGGGGRKVGSVSRQSSTKVVVEVPTDQTVSYEEPDTKWIDTSQAKKFVSWEAKPVLMIENSVAESAINLSRRDSSMAIQSATTFIPPPSTARSVSMRDMGTEMTPIASQEPSRTGTPVRATTPIRSPTSSRPSTPGRTVPAPSPSPTNPSNHHLDLNNDLSEKELQMKTRREIMALGTQLGKMNIAAWASKEEEDKDASTSLKTVAAEQPTKSVIETRAAAWEEAEKAKYMARFKREEMKIQAWENHQKAKTEAEMRKIEVEVERMRGRAHDKLMNKLATARHKAEEKRAEAEAKRNRQAAKTEQQAEYIRRTGRIPSSFSCWSWCS